eukprot:TRINITY_DN31090_c0_g1_i1.p1 TRINITY_DN31090_c0_g1~~TRINITY_DN31090_c0_g1_i1.p1  ORF type:complete len:399 (-),score=62.63 TRINITY_DN31090_c0_g1_i1:256-1452(-)
MTQSWRLRWQSDAVSPLLNAGASLLASDDHSACKVVDSMCDSTPSTCDVNTDASTLTPDASEHDTDEDINTDGMYIEGTDFRSDLSADWEVCKESLRTARAKTVIPNGIFWLRLCFGRRRSRWCGALARVRLPQFLRKPLFRLCAWALDAELHELKRPLDAYETFNDFFCRQLVPCARPIAQLPRGLVSPVDAKLMKVGIVDGYSARVEQVKGATYSVQGFLGHDPTERSKLREGNTLRYAVLYLSPGKYHRFHAPCDVTFENARHISGEFFPLRSLLLENLQDLFCINERVVLSGRWNEGQMHLGAVAAANVGNIFLSFDPKLHTNRDIQVLDKDMDDKGVFAKRFPGGVAMKAGEEVGGFRLGSTVVLVFEASPDFTWLAKVGDTVRVGQPLANTR